MRRGDRFERWVCTTTAGFLFFTVVMPVAAIVLVCAVWEVIR